MHAQQPTYVERLRVTNKHPRALDLYVEPWGDKLKIPSDATYEIVARGPEGDCLEVVFGKAGISVFGWSASTLSVFHKGKVLLEC
jgi:hypothetical protein